jgi:hypothetical protein
MPAKTKEFWVQVVKFSPAPEKIIRQIFCPTKKEAERQEKKALGNLIMMGWSDCAFVKIANEKAPT